MRPLRLALEAMGPYPDEVAIPFGELQEEGLFLIHGQTGAGKTYLLDAMCYALYGVIPGARGNASSDSLRSHFAEPRQRPRVELEFEAQGHVWRVERSPGHEVPKLDGTGVTSRAATFSLERKDAGAWTAIASRKEEVNAEIERLVGLTADQFQRVILLPQGGFQRVLRAGGKERQALLKDLFETDLYERATFWLKSEASTKRQTAAERSARVDTLRRQAALDWRDFHGDDEAGPPPQSAEEIDALVSRAADACSSWEAAVASTRGIHTTRETRLAAAQLEASRWDQRARARTRLQELEDRRANVTADRETLRHAEDAERLRGSLESEKEGRAERTTVLEAALADLGTLRTARAAAVSVPSALDELDTDTLPEQATLTKAQTAVAAHERELEHLAAKARAADTLEGTARDAETAERKARTREETANERQAQAEARRATAETRLQAARSAADRITDLTQAARRAREQAEAAHELQTARRATAKAREALLGAERARDAARAHVLALRATYLDGIAAALATDLVTGQPCPVCGSAEHPQPAVPGTDSVAREVVDAAEEDLEARDRARRTHSGTLTTCETTEATLAARAGDRADDAEAAAQVADEAATALATATAKAAESPGAEADRRAAIENGETARGEAQAAREAWQLARERGAAASREAEEVRADVAATLGTSIDPTQALAGLRTLARALDALAPRCVSVAKAEASWIKARDRLAGELERSPFDTAEAAEGALLDARAQGELRQAVEAFEQEFLKVTHELGAEEWQGLPEERTDLVEPTHARNKAQQELEHAVSERSRAAMTRDKLASLAAQHVEAIEALGAARADADLYSGVASRCDGTVAPRISLERWVLSAYLQEVCTLANRRLEAMTAGRYTLRVQSGHTRGGGAAGLDLEVHDVHTGMGREVNTLSGGETFQASLALALGLADAVQAQHGGVHLDALFVDEGFGTLDAEALDLAMDALDDLRAHGRLVGVISHVGALREKIRWGVEVVRTDTGSDLRVGKVAPE